jgi:hypothetical protein
MKKIIIIISLVLILILLVFFFLNKDKKDSNKIINTNAIKWEQIELKWEIKLKGQTTIVNSNSWFNPLNK